MLRDESDETLLGRYRDGDRRAFEVLLVRHRRGVYNFLRRQVDEQAADDLLQETFLRVVRGADGFTGQSKFTTWLYTIARNVSIDALRRGRHRRAESLDQPGEDGAPKREVAASGPSVEEQAVTRDLAQRIEDALRGLPDDLREVFLMRERAGLSFKEIAQAVGCPENTAKSRMRYALERLRAALAPDEAEEAAR